jgi:hypothetical protein
LMGFSYLIAWEYQLQHAKLLRQSRLRCAQVFRSVNNQHCCATLFSTKLKYAEFQLLNTVYVKTQ